MPTFSDCHIYVYIHTHTHICPHLLGRTSTEGEKETTSHPCFLPAACRSSVLVCAVPWPGAGDGWGLPETTFQLGIPLLGTTPQRGHKAFPKPGGLCQHLRHAPVQGTQQALGVRGPLGQGRVFLLAPRAQPGPAQPPQSLLRTSPWIFEEHQAWSMTGPALGAWALASSGSGDGNREGGTALPT